MQFKSGERLDEFEIVDEVSSIARSYLSNIPGIDRFGALYREVGKYDRVIPDGVPYGMDVLVANRSEMEDNTYYEVVKRGTQYVSEHPTLSVPGVMPGRRMPVRVTSVVDDGLFYINFYWVYPV